MIGAAALAFDGLERRRAGVSGRLIVCPTPIGNLEDVTLRVLAALREADVVACEDTRRTRVLLDRYGVSAKLVSYHEHNERERAAGAGRRGCGPATVVALVSDAGMPLVSDPGFVLVRACVAAGLAVEVLPGPSAALAALVASRAAGRPLALRRLPAAQARRARARCSPRPETLVAFESPRRVAVVAGRAGRARPRAPGRRLPRADQGARGGRARHARPSSPRATRDRAAARRGRARRRRRRPRPRGRHRAGARRAAAAGRRPGPSRGRPPASWPS